MLDIETITHAGSLLGIILVSLIVFVESGLLIGFFLPGDTLLFGAGLAASQGRVSLILLIVSVVLAAIIGDNVGYSIGRRMGRRIYRKQDGILFRKEYIEVSERFYEKHGGKTIILARFTPLVRTFAPVVAGASKMTRQRFLLFNIIGGTLWGAGMPLLGFFLGSRIPWLNDYIDYVILGVIALSILIALVHILKDSQTRAIIIQRAKDLISKILLNKRVQ